MVFLGPLGNGYGCTIAGGMEIVFRDETEGY